MSKKLLIGLIVVIVIFLGVWVFRFAKGPGLPKLWPEAGEVPYRPREEVKVGYGWSVKNDVKEAVQEAVSAALKDTEETPEYAVLYSTSGYDSEELSKELNRLLPNTKIHGGTSMKAVFTRDGYHIGEKASLALLVVSSPEIDFGVGGADINGLTAEQAGELATLAAIKDAGREGEIPKLMHLIGSFGNESGILDGIANVVGNDVPVIGGTAFDDDMSGKWNQFANNEVYVNGLSLTAFFTDLKIGWAFESGYKRTKHSGVVTNAVYGTIYEIDNRPALDVYDEWTGGLVTKIKNDLEELPETLVVVEETALFPFARIIYGERGEVHYFPMHPFFWDFKDGSVGVGVAVETGDEVTVVHGTWEINLNHAQTTPSKALAKENIKKGEGYFAIFSYCGGKMLTLPEDERSKIPLVANGALGNVPFIGGNTGGEQGFLEGVGNEHGGLRTAIIVVGPKD